ncbi:monovalent cation/H+ antiporter subunit D family protein [Natronomonas gomsonensis]|uniref:monovalent cation/H+ antiporter subunit D family protein n=1 Tax=Natronomonas gomsonensis TaxID=1046043 RepID=UPI0015BCA15E|nr:monovalent cation/H+ antiporter subunit D family protein [Natronomonas gomsonensis]
MTDIVLPLLIAVPIVAAVAPLLLSLWSTETGWPVATVAALIETGLAAILLRSVYLDGRLVHEVGGYPAPYGIELVGDGLSAPIVALVAVVSLGVVAFARSAGPRRNSFYSAYLLCVGGLMGISITGDLFNMFVFLEITGLATYALVAADRSGESAIAALKYLLLGTTGASLFLIGVGYALIATGTLNMVDLSAQLADIYTTPGGSRVVLASFGFIAVGLALKAAIFPLHTWQPDAYTYAPDTVTVFIAALASTVYAYALGRVVLTVFTVDFFDAVPLAQDGLLALATVSILAGSALAAVQSEVKRMFAYSSVAQFGLVVAAFALATPDSVLGGVIHLVGHGLMKGGLFAAAAILAARHGARTVDDYARLGYRSPVVAAALGVLGFALVGVPPSIGFLGKWYVALGAVRAEAWPVAVVVFLSTLFTLVYVARLLERLYFADPGSAPTPAPGDTEAVADGGDESEEDRIDSRAPEAVSVGMVAVVVLTALVVVALGFATSGFETLLEPVLSEVFSQ